MAKVVIKDEEPTPEETSATLYSVQNITDHPICLEQGIIEAREVGTATQAEVANHYNSIKRVVEPNVNKTK